MKSSVHWVRCVSVTEAYGNMFPPKVAGCQRHDSAGAFDSATSLIEAPEACTRPAATITTVAVPRVARVSSQSDPMFTSPVSGSMRDDSNHSGTANEALTPQLPGMDLSICNRFPQVDLTLAAHVFERRHLV